MKRTHVIKSIGFVHNRKVLLPVRGCEVHYVGQKGGSETTPPPPSFLLKQYFKSMLRIRICGSGFKNSDPDPT